MRMNGRNDRGGGGRGGRAAKVEEVMDNTIDYVQCDGLVRITESFRFLSISQHLSIHFNL